MFYFLLRFLACFCRRLPGFCGRFAGFCGCLSEFPDLRAFASKTRQTPKLAEISSRWKLQVRFKDRWKYAEIDMHIVQSLGFCRMFPTSPGRLSWILPVYPDASPAPACLSRNNRPMKEPLHPKRMHETSKQMLVTTVCWWICSLHSYTFITYFPLSTSSQMIGQTETLPNWSEHFDLTNFGSPTVSPNCITQLSPPSPPCCILPPPKKRPLAKSR